MTEKYRPKPIGKEAGEKKAARFSLNKTLITLVLSGIIAGGLSEEKVRNQIPGHELLEEVGNRVNGAFNKIKDLISKGLLTDPKVEKEIEKIEGGGRIEDDSVKINFDNTGKVESVEIKKPAKDERSVDLQKKLLYISNYFRSSDIELSVLNSNPSSKVVCEFSDFLNRVEQNKRSLEQVWNYISLNIENKKLPVNLVNNIQNLLTQASLLKPVTIDSVKQNLSQPAERGTICGFKFNLAFSFITNERIGIFQKLSKEIISDLALHLKEKIEGDNVEDRESAMNTAAELSNLIFKKIEKPQ